MLLNEHIIADIKQIISQAREQAVRAVDFQRVLMYWHIGKRIFEEEQQGKERADYGKFLIKNLAERLQPEFGSGFSPRQLERYRQFYRVYPIASALRTQLNWTQYKFLISINDEDKRSFYIAETVKNNWSSRQLERQINSQLYERLLLSNDKQSVLAVAHNQNIPDNPRQIIEIKTHKLTHQDLGQLQMYVNYFDRVEKLPRENPTIGILLCADKNDSVVKFSLPQDQKQIFASQYQLYLPSEQLLLNEMQKEIDNFNQKQPFE